MMSVDIVSIDVEEHARLLHHENSGPQRKRGIELRDRQRVERAPAPAHIGRSCARGTSGMLRDLVRFMGCGATAVHPPTIANASRRAQAARLCSSVRGAWPMAAAMRPKSSAMILNAPNRNAAPQCCRLRMNPRTSSNGLIGAAGAGR